MDQLTKMASTEGVESWEGLQRVHTLSAGSSLWSPDISDSVLSNYKSLQLVQYSPCLGQEPVEVEEGRSG